MDCSPPGSSAHGISQEILEWVAISSSRGSSWPRDGTQVSWMGRWILYHWVPREVQQRMDTYSRTETWEDRRRLPATSHSHLLLSRQVQASVPTPWSRRSPRPLCPRGFLVALKGLKWLSRRPGAGLPDSMLSPSAQPWSLGCHPPAHKVIVRIWPYKTSGKTKKRGKSANPVQDTLRYYPPMTESC